MTTARRAGRRRCPLRRNRWRHVRRSSCAPALWPFILAAAISSPAHAQSWEFRFSEPVLSRETPSTTVTLRASFPRADWAFAGAWLDVHASEPAWSEPKALIDWSPGQMPGMVTPDGRGVTDVSVGQLWTFARGPDAANPIAVWQATFTATDFSTAREILFSTATERFLVYIDPTGMIRTPEPRTPIDIEAAIRVIPAPAPVALLALAGIAATTRRRPH